MHFTGDENITLTYDPANCEQLPTEVDLQCANIRIEDDMEVERDELILILDGKDLPPKIIKWSLFQLMMMMMVREAESVTAPLPHLRDICDNMYVCLSTVARVGLCMAPFSIIQLSRL